LQQELYFFQPASSKGPAQNLSAAVALWHSFALQSKLEVP